MYSETCRPITLIPVLAGLKSLIPEEFVSNMLSLSGTCVLRSFLRLLLRDHCRLPQAIRKPPV